jgi:hypothetical protein
MLTKYSLNLLAMSMGSVIFLFEFFCKKLGSISLVLFLFRTLFIVCHVIFISVLYFKNWMREINKMNGGRGKGVRQERLGEEASQESKKNLVKESC